MKRIRLLLLLTFLTHFFTLFGYAHAAGFIGLAEILYFPYVTHEHFSLILTDTQESYLPAVAMLGFIGNITLLVAFFMKHTHTRNIVYYTGIMAYWMSIAYLWYDSTFLGHSQFSLVFCVPLLLASTLLITQKRLARVSGWIKN